MQEQEQLEDLRTADPEFTAERSVVYDMVEYLGRFGRNPRHETTMCKDSPLEIPAGSDFSGGHFYSCKNLCGGRCGIYETRPQMCRSYPNGRRCVFVLCTMVTPIDALIEEAWRLYKDSYVVVDIPEWSQQMAWGEVRYPEGWEETLKSECLELMTESPG